MSENVLRLDHVTMQFGGVVAVNDLSMEVNDKEIVALICFAISTLSNTVRLLNRRIFWKVRAMPSLVIWSGVGLTTWLNSG